MTPPSGTHQHHAFEHGHIQGHEVFMGFDNCHANMLIEVSAEGDSFLKMIFAECSSLESTAVWKCGLLTLT
jgi:hypothetical protein